MCFGVGLGLDYWVLWGLGALAMWWGGFGLGLLQVFSDVGLLLVSGLVLGLGWVVMGFWVVV